ncbi:hypothetical protein KS4_09550 [Poriferisphaera corsica]|uniref:HEAT repeat domain-containing protein n=1 Tax=Poriferisphaera corsica TaxID=2528020 RepID=A0A517YRS7_9BACT|nr:HEAT repeat domain-containing protein [Poriferisphaera corsica]QDU32916.1 hypothetical protein KS4_09550 [Poriferisphaera corsica]
MGLYSHRGRNQQSHHNPVFGVRCRHWLSVTLFSCLLWGCSAAPTGMLPDAILDITPVKSESQAKYIQLSDEKNPTDQRREAADYLLALGSTESISLLNKSIVSNSDPQATDAVLQAIILSPSTPPTSLYDSLRGLLLRAEGNLRFRAAEAISRYNNDDAIRTNIIRLANNDKSQIEHRQAAILVLSRMHSRIAAQALINLTAPEQPDAIRADTYVALALLAGDNTRGQDRAKWLSWWELARTWSKDRWYASLINNTTRQNARQRLELEETTQYLFALGRSSYRNSSESDRPKILAYMLTHLRPVRQLAMELVLERILDRQPFDENLLTALRDRLTDSNANIRQLAALRLNDLLDQPAAKMIANRLQNKQEISQSVINADLLLLTNMPQANAVETALNLLENPALQHTAAGMLAAASEHSLLSETQAAQAAVYVRQMFKHPNGISPQSIRLLGKVGRDNDWNTIAELIDHEDPALRQAAAQAWADSDRSLKILADRVSDLIIQPIVIGAATQRGNDPFTLFELAKYPPEQQQNREAWGRALSAMAGRVSPDTVLTITEGILNIEHVNPEAAVLAESMITASLEAHQQHDQFKSEMMLLRLDRAEIWLKASNVAGAIGDYQYINQNISDLLMPHRSRFYRGFIKTQLQRDAIESAFDIARDLFKLIKLRGIAPTDDPIVNLFTTQAKYYIDAQRYEEAQLILDKLRDLLGDQISPDAALKLNQLDNQLSSP